MHIVINTSVLVTARTGVGTFVYEAARALREASGAHRYTYYDGRFSERLAEPAGTGDLARRAKALIDRVPPARALARRVAHGVHRVSVRGRRFDLYWEPNYIPVALDARRLVITVHDLSVVTHPEWHPKDRVAHFRRHFAAGLARADVVTADSEFTRGELIDLLRLDPARVRVVYPGCDPTRFRPRQDAAAATDFPERYILVVGALDPRKNVARLLDAWTLLPAAVRRDAKLVLAGFEGSRNPTLAKKIRAMGGGVVSLGYLSADDLARAYASATALAYPSLYEGFGLPALEAMASGCPVVASDIAPVREVCADAAEWVDPASVESIAAGLERVLSNDARRNELREQGLARARCFTWNAAAQRLLALFEELHPA